MRTSYSSSYSYRVGGSLSAHDPTYVTRQVDNLLFQAIQQGCFCHVRGPRQVGKSSLRIKTRQRLEGEGYRCATVQVTDIILSSQAGSVLSPSVSAAQLGDQPSWDKQLIALIWDSLHPTQSRAIAHWLQTTARLSCQRRLEHFTHDLLFPELREKPLVIFMDEIDYLFTSPEAVQELLGWIAKCYGLRDQYGEYQPLNFVMLGSTPWSVMTQFSAPESRDRTAHHLAIQHLLAAELICEMTLDNFKLSEMQPLQQGLRDHFSSPIAVLHSVYRWTGGQPFLTQKLCQMITHQAKVLSPETLQRLSAASTELNRWMDRIVQSNILDNWADNDEPVHLTSIRDRLAQSPRHLALNHLYNRISSGDRIPYSGSTLQSELLLSGLVLCQQQYLCPANKIYQAVFAQQSTQPETQPETQQSTQQPTQQNRQGSFSSDFCNHNTERNNRHEFAKSTIKHTLHSSAKNTINIMINNPTQSATRFLAPH